MLLTNRYKQLLLASGLSWTVLVAAASVQAASCSDQPGQTACGETENSVSWVFQSDNSVNSTPAQQDIQPSAVQPLVLASSDNQPSSADAGAAAEGGAVTIEDSLTAGLSLSNSLAASRQAFIVARQASGTATAANDLTGRLSFSGSDIRTDTKVRTGGFVRDESRVGSITLNKRVYDSGESETRLRVADLDLNRARAQHHLAEQNVIFDIISAHLSVLTAQKAFAIRDANMRRLTAHTEAARIRLDAGTSTPTRLAEAEARLARAQSDKIVAEAALQTALEAYQSLTGLEAQSLRGFDGPAVLPQSMTDAEAQANAEHPSVIAAVLGEKVQACSLKFCSNLCCQKWISVFQPARLTEKVFPWTRAK